jgi:HK97 family phage major capsid protein
MPDLTELTGIANDLRSHFDDFKDRYEEREREIKRLQDRVTSLECAAIKHADGLDTYHRPSGEDGKAVGPFLPLSAKAADHFAYTGPVDPAEAQDARLGAMVLGLASTSVKDHLSDVESKALLSGLTGSAGGFLVPDAIGGRFIDLARNKARVMRAGAVTLAMPAAEVSLPGWETAPGAAWRGEGGAFAEASASFRAVVLRAKSLAARVPLTIELIEDAASNLSAVSSLVENAIAAAVAVEIDRAVLVGSGTDHEPLGILNTPGVNTTSTFGTPTNYDGLVDLIYDVKGRNHEPRAAIMSPAVGGVYAKLADTSGQPMRAPEAVGAISRHESKNCPDANIFVGDFGQVVIGVRPSISLRVLTDPYSGSGNGKVYVNAFVRCDVAVLDTDGLQVATGVTTS